MSEPEDRIVFTTEEFGLLVACAIVALWLLSFAIGYDFGKEIGYDIFGNKG